MVIVRKYWKNSNTNEVCTSTEYTDTKIDFPIHFYDIKGEKIGENLKLIGFVEINEKNFNKIKRKYEKK